MISEQSPLGRKTVWVIKIDERILIFFIKIDEKNFLSSKLIIIKIDELSSKLMKEFWSHFSKYVVRA